MVLLDLDEIKQREHLKQMFGPLLSKMYSFDDHNHIDGSNLDVRQKILDYVDKSSGLSGARIANIQLLTNLKFAGFVFSPISVFYCYDNTGSLLASVVEVENTFRERKLYMIDCPESAANGDQEKAFYVSPFSSVDGRFQFHITAPTEILNLEVVSRNQNETLLRAGLQGKRFELNAGNLWKMTFRYPCSSLLVWLAIHIHAGILFLKGVPHYRKEEKPELQKPHYSRQTQR